MPADYLPSRSTPRNPPPRTAQVVLRPRVPMALRLPDSRGEAANILHRLTGPGTRRPVFDSARDVYLLPKIHVDAVVRGLARRYDEVIVWQYGDPRTSCHPSCLTARSPRYMCECSCAGKGHGEEASRITDVLKDAVTRTGLVVTGEVYLSSPIPFRRFTVRRDPAAGA